MAIPPFMQYQQAQEQQPADPLTGLLAGYRQMIPDQQTLMNQVQAEPLVARQKKPGGILGQLISNPGFWEGLQGFGAQMAQASQARIGGKRPTWATGLAAGFGGFNQGMQSYEDRIAKQQAEQYQRLIEQRKLELQQQQEDRLSSRMLTPDGSSPRLSDYQYRVELYAQDLMDKDPSLTPEVAKRMAAIQIDRMPQVAAAERQQRGEGNRDENTRNQQAFQLRGEYRSAIKPINDYGAKLRQAQALLASSQSGVADVAIVNTFQKLIDEGAVVREGDVELLSTTGGVFGRLTNLFNGVRGSGKLPPETRAQMIETLRQLEQQFRGRVSGLRDDYMGQAESFGLDPMMVLGEKRKQKPAGEVDPASVNQPTPKKLDPKNDPDNW